MSVPGHSVLVIPVPALEPWIRERTQHYDASFLGIDDDFCNAHITLLGPWLPQPSALALQRVGDIAARTEPFDYSLADYGVFPDGIVYLAPTPAAPLRALTSALSQAFPEYPPYGGAFGDVVPHLTLDQLSDDVSLESVQRSIRSQLPVQARASRIDLQWWANDNCHRMASWELVGELG